MKTEHVIFISIDVGKIDIIKRPVKYIYKPEGETGWAVEFADNRNGMIKRAGLFRAKNLNRLPFMQFAVRTLEEAKEVLLMDISKKIESKRKDLEHLENVYKSVSEKEIV